MIVQEIARPRSNASDLLYTTQIIDLDDGQPMWATAPVDLVVTVTIRDGDGIDRISAKNTLSPTEVTVLPDAYLKIFFAATKMSALEEGRYTVRAKFETDGRTIERILGYLPITEGNPR